MVSSRWVSRASATAALSRWRACSIRGLVAQSLPVPVWPGQGELDGAGEGLGDGEPLGEGDGDADGDADGDGEGEGDGLGDGDVSAAA